MSDEAPPPPPLPNPLGPLSPHTSSDASSHGSGPRGGFSTYTPPPPTHLFLGIIGGVAAAIVGAVAWAAIAVMANLEVGYVAVGLAFLVGLAVRTLGRGNDITFGLVGAACSMLGLVLGKVFTVVWVVVDQQKAPILTVVQALDWAKVFEVIGKNLNPIDILFGGLALWLGFKYSMRKS